MKNKVSADSGNHDEVDENNLINKEFLVTILLTNKNTAMDTENEINNIMNRNKELVKETLETNSKIDECDNIIKTIEEHQQKIQELKSENNELLFQNERYDTTMKLVWNKISSLGYKYKQESIAKTQTQSFKFLIPICILLLLWNVYRLIV